MKKFLYLFLVFAINSIAFNPCMYGNCMHDTYGHPNDVYKAQIISNIGSLNGNTDYNRYIPGAWQSANAGHAPAGRARCRTEQGRFRHRKIRRREMTKFVPQAIHAAQMFHR